MKHFGFLIVAMLIASMAFSQITVFSENFDGPTQNVVSSSASGNNVGWDLSSRFQSNGTHSDSASVVLSDTLYLTTNAFSTIGYTFVTLNFDQICKVDFFDKGYVEVSSDSGANWTRLTSAEYTGTGFFSTSSFSSITYAIWDAINGNATPNNTWWQSESFNITSIAASQNAMVRFMLEDADNNGAVNNYGWLVDNIEVVAAPCELIPPSIALSSTAPQGLVYTTGPYSIDATITDASGINSAKLIYQVNNLPLDTVNMVLTGMSNYNGIINVPNLMVGDSICYYIEAIDNSSCSNLQRFPSIGCVQFKIGTNPPPVCVGTPVFNYDYSEAFASFTPGNGRTTIGTLQNNWINDINDNHDWWVYDQATRSNNTGPSGNHSIGDANYMYIEPSNGFTNRTAVLNTPCFDLNGLFAPEFKFWYHMLGVSMGELHVDIYFGGQWVNDVTPAIIGNQGNQWLERKIDLSAYSGNIVKLRFRGITGNGITSDIAIDDIELVEPPRQDIALSDIFSPSPNGCSGSSNEFMTIELTNLGSKTQDTIPVAYQVNNGAIVIDTAFLSLTNGQTANFTFQQTVNMSAPGTYNFRFWTALIGDLDNTNDSILTYAISTSTIYNQLPDTNNFDNFTVGVPGTLLDGWSNSVFDTHDWYVNSGVTLSPNTGPSGDNTTGLGNYIYVEATNLFNRTAILNSKCIDISNLNRPELTFYHHMLGIDQGELHLDISVNGFVIADIIPAIVGNQGANWNLITVDLTPYKGIVKLVFRGITGNDYRSDIAIDDVVIRDAMPVGINEENELNNSFSFYPNPATSQLFVNKPDSENTQLRIFDSKGQLMYEEWINSSKSVLDISAFSKGIYIIEFQNEKALQRERLIIQ